MQVKTQPTVEYLFVYIFAIFILGLVITLIFVFSQSPNSTTLTTPYCYLGTQLQCQQLLVLSGNTPTNAIILFTNNLHSTIHLPVNSFWVALGTSSTFYSGNCIPVNAPYGATVTCNVTTSIQYNAGLRLNPRIAVTYQICATPSCTTYATNAVNITGTGYVEVQPYAAAVSLVTLLDSPTSGNIVISGVRYPSGSNVALLNNFVYYMGAIPPLGMIFVTWKVTGGVSVANSVLISTTATTNSYGIFNAVFEIPPTPSISPTAGSTDDYILGVCKSQVFTASTSGGTTPYTYNWFWSTAQSVTCGPNAASNAQGSSFTAPPPSNGHNPIVYYLVVNAVDSTGLHGCSAVATDDYGWSGSAC